MATVTTGCVSAGLFINPGGKRIVIIAGSIGWQWIGAVDDIAQAFIGVVDVCRFDHHDALRLAVETRIGKQLGSLLEVENGEPELAVLVVDTGATADDLLELGHGLDVLVQHHQLAGLGIDASGHQLGSGGNDRIGLFRVDEVVELGLAKVIIAGDFHHIALILGHLFRVEVYQGTAHSVGMIDVVAEHYGLGHRVGFLEVVGDGFGHQLGTLVDHQSAVEILLVIDTVFNQVALFVHLPFGRAPPLQINVYIDPHHLVGGKKTIFDPLFEGVGINRVTEVIGVGDGFGLFGRGGETNLGGR